MTHSLDRRERTRRRSHVVWDVFFRALRGAAERANDFRVAVGIFLLAGAAVAVAGTWIFTELAERVRAGSTLAFDSTVLAWLGAHRVGWVERSLLEITALGTGLVVLVVVGVAALFLWLTTHRYSAALLLVTAAGGIVLNNVLKVHFSRPRPQIFAWGQQVSTSSFPSGHAMSATIVYATVAYLAARLQRRRWARWLTMLAAAVVIALVCLSRMYLGVHYPSDVAAGAAIGLAWAGFCMATLEAVQRFARHNAPEMVEDEAPPPPRES